MAASIPTNMNIMEIPAARPPPGVKSNFDNPSTLKRSIIVVNAVFLALMILVVIIRFLSKRLVIRQRYNWSDATCLVATLGSIAHTGLTIHATTRGFGRHQYDMRAISLMQPTPKIFASIDIIYVVTMYFVKISLLLLFWQFFSVMTGARRAIIFGFVFISIFNVPYLTISCLRVARCHIIGLKICSNGVVSTTNIVFGTFNLLTDFFIVAIPISQVRKLNVEAKRKWAVMLLFLTGLIACSMSIVRLGIVANDLGSTDTLWTAATVSRFSAVEMKLAIICGSVMHLPAFIKQSKSSLSSAYMSLTRQMGGSTKSPIPEKRSEESLRNKNALGQIDSHGPREPDYADLDVAILSQPVQPSR